MSIAITYKRESDSRAKKETLITDMNNRTDAARVGEYIRQALKSPLPPREITIKQLPC